MKLESCYSAQVCVCMALNHGNMFFKDMAGVILCFSYYEQIPEANNVLVYLSLFADFLACGAQPQTCLVTNI